MGFKIQGADGDLARTVCVAIPGKEEAQVRALQKAQGVVVSEEPLTDEMLRNLELKPFEAKIL